jgi:hypothetical protein
VLDSSRSLAYSARAMIRLVAWLVMTLTLTSCKVGPLGPYTSPRVIGQVCAADSGDPLADASVSRNRIEKPSMEKPKGGELLMQKLPVMTDHDGRFSLDSERVLSVVRGSGWNEVRLTFEKIGFERLRTNFPASLATNAPGDETLLDVGSVLLQPLHR